MVFVFLIWCFKTILNYRSTVGEGVDKWPTRNWYGDCQLLWRQRPTIVFSINISENIPILRIFIIFYIPKWNFRIFKIRGFTYQKILSTPFVSVRFSKVRYVPSTFCLTSRLHHCPIRKLYQRALWQVQSARQSSK